MKERDTVILSARIKKNLLEKLNSHISKSRKKTRNSWLMWAIESGMRPHRKKGDN